jgi:DNA-directed RNA polymerase subunit RPC12/RpoP
MIEFYSICAKCGKGFTSKWTKEEFEAEVNIFGYLTEEESYYVCDECSKSVLMKN